MRIVSPISKPSRAKMRSVSNLVCVISWYGILLVILGLLKTICLDLWIFQQRTTGKTEKNGKKVKQQWKVERYTAPDRRKDIPGMSLPYDRRNTYLVSVFMCVLFTSAACSTRILLCIRKAVSSNQESCMYISTPSSYL